MIKPTANFHPSFLDSVANLARVYTTEQNYVEFDLNIILETRARKDFFNKLNSEAQQLVGNIYEVDGTSESTNRDMKTIAERWTTVLEQPEIDGFKYVSYISERHTAALKEMSPAIIEAAPFYEDPQANREEDEDDVERDEAAGMTQPNVQPQQRPSPQNPPEATPPTSPLQNQKIHLPQREQPRHGRQ